MRNAFAEGLTEIAELQKKLQRPPKRHLVTSLVKDLVRRVGMKGDKREHYFRLLATCALMGIEPLHNNYPTKRRKRA